MFAELHKNSENLNRDLNLTLRTIFAQSETVSSNACALFPVYPSDFCVTAIAENVA